MAPEGAQKTHLGAVEEIRHGILSESNPAQKKIVRDALFNLTPVLAKLPKNDVIRSVIADVAQNLTPVEFGGQDTTLFEVATEINKAKASWSIAVENDPKTGKLLLTYSDSKNDEAGGAVQISLAETDKKGRVGNIYEIIEIKKNIVTCFINPDVVYGKA